MLRGAEICKAPILLSAALQTSSLDCILQPELSLYWASRVSENTPKNVLLRTWQFRHFYWIDGLCTVRSLSPHLILLYTSIHHSRSISLGVYGPWGFILTSPILFSPLKNHPSLSVVAFIVALHPQRSIDRNKCALEPFGLSALFSLSVLHGTKCFWVDSFLGVFGLPNKK